MSEFNVGDKVYAEVVIIAKDNGFYAINADGNTENPYVHFVISEKYLHKIPEKTYEDWLNEAWELAKKIVLTEPNSIKADDLLDIFGEKYCGYCAAILRDFSPQETVAKIKKFEDAKDIHVGDVVTFDNLNAPKGVVIKKAGEYSILLSTGEMIYRSSKNLKKTGRTIDVESILKQIGGTT